MFYQQTTPSVCWSCSPFFSHSFHVFLNAVHLSQTRAITLPLPLHLLGICSLCQMIASIGIPPVVPSELCHRHCKCRQLLLCCFFIDLHRKTHKTRMKDNQMTNLINIINYTVCALFYFLRLSVFDMAIALRGNAYDRC